MVVGGVVEFNGLWKWRKSAEAGMEGEVTGRAVYPSIGNRVRRHTSGVGALALANGSRGVIYCKTIHLRIFLPCAVAAQVVAVLGHAR